MRTRKQRELYCEFFQNERICSKIPARSWSFLGPGCEKMLTDTPLPPCAHTTLWLKVSQRAHSLHPHAIHDVTCLNVRCLFSFCLLPSSLSLAPPLSLHCLPVLCPAHQLPQCRIRRGLKPLHSPTMRSIAPWRCTTLSQVMSPSSSTTYCRTRAMRNTTMRLSEKRYLHHCSFRSEKNQRT